MVTGVREHGSSLPAVRLHMSVCSACGSGLHPVAEATHFTDGS